ncbi:hypothetical protein Pst134EA_030479 [Puccinia striiformis f. sp. tritici]|uniref:hypothetical protein n=1 Tax=Puccinia striiformis f. sp. tritici TaxID=168172 RepID=UPI00200753C8|nr:hypothetical protein Pst134EA_030479 [Puccinia striiformis f. sp. tritici]KAH9440399.1 hypothetical protein Pst134EB_031014 [Puccinia striiformis f. sp. tritici]KAH9446566.1 hypothetical protein Pst134EA_030479 [Puccinia striiformis f. sp. tritici]
MNRSTIPPLIALGIIRLINSSFLAPYDESTQAGLRVFDKREQQSDQLFRL